MSLASRVETELLKYPPSCEDFRAGFKLGAELIAKESDALLKAVHALYYSACWTADRSVDEAALWTAVRDAAGFAPGSSPAPQTVIDARFGDTPQRHRHDWITHTFENGAVLSTCSFCGNVTQLR